MDNLKEKAKTIVSRRGASKQLAKLLREEISSGKYHPGDRLLTMHEMIQATNLGYSTVNRAVSILVEEGILESRKGAGTFIKEIAQDTEERKTNEFSDIFALVIPEVRSGLYCALQYGFEEQAAQYQKQILVCNTDNIITRQSDIIMQLIDKQVSGIAIVPCTTAPMPPYQIRALKKAHIPIVQLHRRSDGLAAPYISIPFEKVGETAGRIIADHQHTNAAILSSSLSQASQGYVNGVRKSLREAGLKQDVPFYHSTYPAEGWNQELLEIIHRFICSPNRPTAVFTSYDDIAERVYLAALNHGIKIPDDLFIVTFGAFYRKGAIEKQIHAVTVDETWAGHKAAHLLQEMSLGRRSLDSKEEFTMRIFVYEGKDGLEKNSSIRAADYAENSLLT